MTMRKKSKKSSQTWLYANHGSAFHFHFLPFCLFAFFLFFSSLSSFAEDSGQAPETTKTAADAPGDSLSLAIPSVNTVQADGRTSFVPKDIIPSKAMLHSLLIPGGGQLDNGRRKKALLFLATELVCLGGVIYETHLLGGTNLSPFDKEIIRTNRNTFIIVWLGAKLFGMVDAYVDAQLKHFNVGDVTPPGMENSDNGQSKK